MSSLSQEKLDEHDRQEIEDIICKNQVSEDSEEDIFHTANMKFSLSTTDLQEIPFIHIEDQQFNFNEKIKIKVIFPQSFLITKWDWIGLYKIEKNHKYYSNYIWVSKYKLDDQQVKIEIEFTSPSEIGGHYHFRYFTYRDNNSEYQNISESDLIWIGAKYILKSSNIKSNSVDLEISRIKGNKSESWSWVGLYQMGETNPHKYINWKYLSENKIITFPLPSCSTWHFKFFPTKRRSSTPAIVTICNYSFALTSLPIQNPFIILERLKINVLLPIFCKCYEQDNTMTIDEMNVYMENYSSVMKNMAKYLKEENKDIIENLWYEIAKYGEHYLSSHHYEDLINQSIQFELSDNYDILNEIISCGSLYMTNPKSNIPFYLFFEKLRTDCRVIPYLEDSKSNNIKYIEIFSQFPEFIKYITKIYQTTFESVCGGKVNKKLFVNNYMKIRMKYSWYSSVGNTTSKFKEFFQNQLVKCPSDFLYQEVKDYIKIHCN